MRKRALTLNVLLLLVVNDSLDGIAQLLMKKGLAHTGINAVTFGNILEFTLKSASSCMVWLGIFVYALSFLLWIIILSRVDVSVAVPMTNASYIIIPILAVFFLHENVSLLRWSGIALIFIGMYFISRSKSAADKRGGP
jgi:drug/metabolite transporter (DMT)-like permease